MKKSLSLLLLLSASCILTASAQIEKPRYFTRPTGVCPIDMNLQLAPKGLLEANSQTIGIDSNAIKPQKAAKDMYASDGKTVTVKAGDFYLANVPDTTLKQTIFFEKGTAFDVIAVIGSYSIIRLWDTKKKTKEDSYSIYNASASAGKTVNQLTSDPTTTIDHYRVYQGGNVIANLTQNAYILPSASLKDNSTEFEFKKNKWNVGVLVLPVKVRPFATESCQFDFTDGFSVGTTFSFTIRHKWLQDKTENILIYTGLSSFTADSSKIKEAREDYKISSFSPAIGFMREKSGVQFSVLVGMDFPVGNIQKKWVYRNMPWAAVGLGFSLFKLSSSGNGESGTNK